MMIRLVRHQLPRSHHSRITSFLKKTECAVGGAERWSSSLSTAKTNPAAVEEASSCPFTGAGAGKDPSLSSSSEAQTKLYEVPSLPYLGTMIPQYSKTPKLDMEVIRDFYPECRERFGDFYKLGMPGMGKGIKGEVYVVTNPHEMQKVVRQERTKQPYPRGVFESEWPAVKWFKGRNSPLGVGTQAPQDEDGYSGRGETWKRLRTFLQTDMLSPQAAHGYIPGMVTAAELASKGAPASSSSLNKYLNRCSFDMFCSMMFGEMTQIANPETVDDNRENEVFCEASVQAMDKLFTQLTSPWHNILNNFGVDTSLYKEMATSFDVATDIAKKKYYDFRKSYDDNSLTDVERNSYLGRAILRQKTANDGGEVTISDVDLQELVIVSLVAAIDTTSSVLGWNLINLAMNPNVQKKLRCEIQDSVSKHNGLNKESLSRDSAPYLHAVIRESHRLTPAIMASIIKENSLSDIEIHGTVIPKDSVFLYDSYSLGIDPKLVDSPKLFQPERWFPDAVQERKGTPSEIIDHPFCKDPFSQGSRKCPGSRIASNEIMVLMAQLVLDWNISAPEQYKSVDDVDYSFHGMIIPNLPKLEFTPTTC